MAKNWSTAVNTKAYGLDTAPIENIEFTEYKSGRKIARLKNSTPKNSFSFMLRMEDAGAASEYKVFLRWYADVIKSGAETFLFPDLITHTGLCEYRMLSYSAKGQRIKEISLQFEEV